MSPRSTLDRLFDTFIERHEAAFDTITSANERSYRFARSVLEGTRQGLHDWNQVARSWAQRPTDVMGLYEAASEAVASGQARNIALWQEFLEDLAESQREGREVMRQNLGDVRQAVERVQENVPSFLRRVPRLGGDQAEPVAKT
ncbi:MAG: hypothetical protein WD379_00350 [Dehalococcoidia bacterium]